MVVLTSRRRCSPSAGLLLRASTARGDNSRVAGAFQTRAIRHVEPVPIASEGARLVRPRRNYGHPAGSGGSPAPAEISMRRGVRPNHLRFEGPTSRRLITSTRQPRLANREPNGNSESQSRHLRHRVSLRPGNSTDAPALFGRYCNERGRSGGTSATGGNLLRRFVESTRAARTNRLSSPSRAM